MTILCFETDSMVALVVAHNGDPRYHDIWRNKTGEGEQMPSEAVQKAYQLGKDYEHTYGG